ncbi:MAG: diacylglycerol kinase [Sphingomonadales bacterium]|nr:diacylglycerol kinase [Sphingomonadales bacterium]
MKNTGLHRRILFALAGIRDGFVREKAFRQQSIAIVLAIVMLAIVRPPAIWSALLLATLAAALAMELMNGAVETLADHLHADRHEAIRIVKDMSSAAVLVLNLANAALAIWIIVAAL